MNELELCGALWVNQSESGRRFLGGNIDIGETRYKVLIFRNDKEDPESKKPDYRVMLKGSEPRPQQARPKPPPGADSADDFSF